ncbi:MAG: hypothetical protein AAGU27_21945 [Dehalobacterium sp.]
MMTGKKKNDTREQYFAGKISAKEYLERIEQSKEGDRRRRSIEEQFNKLTLSSHKIK